jgi:hypothetical protein
VGEKFPQFPSLNVIIENFRGVVVISSVMAEAKINLSFN